jgi:hypothetical protein
MHWMSKQLCFAFHIATPPIILHSPIATRMPVYADIQKKSLTLSHWYADGECTKVVEKSVAEDAVVVDGPGAEHYTAV